jgi:hypothetical protein
MTAQRRRFDQGMFNRIMDPIDHYMKISDTYGLPTLVTAGDMRGGSRGRDEWGWGQVRNVYTEARLQRQVPERLRVVGSMPMVRGGVLEELWPGVVSGGGWGEITRPRNAVAYPVPPPQPWLV